MMSDQLLTMSVFINAPTHVTQSGPFVFNASLHKAVRIVELSLPSKIDADYPVNPD